MKKYLLFVSGLLVVTGIIQARWSVFDGDPSVMSGDGVFVQAANLGSSAMVQNINGITYGVDYSNITGASAASDTWAGKYYSGPDPAVSNLLNNGGKVSVSTSTTMTFTLSGLTVGNDYSFQLLLGGSYSGCAANLYGSYWNDYRYVYFANGSSPKLATYTWTADAPSRIIRTNAGAGQGDHFNLAYSLHDVTPPNPDFSRDAYVDIDDLRLLVDKWLMDCRTSDCTEADLNDSGKVEIGDFVVLADAWLTSRPPGLAAFWKLDEGGGVVACDTLGLNDGRLYRTEHDDWIAYGDGYVLDLDGQSESDGLGEYLYLPRQVQDDFSISFRLRTNQKANEGVQWWEGRGLLDAESTGVQNDFGITLLGNKAAFGVGGSDTGDVTIVSATSVNDGLWHQITATRNSATGEMKLYIDGLLEAGAIGSTGTKDARSRILAGSMNFRNNKYLRGSFDDIRLYDRELTPAEVAALTFKKNPAVTYKKGAGTGNADKIHALNAAWIYNWNISRPAGLDHSIDYVPMRWGKWWPGLEKLASVGVVDYFLGYNEPDSSNQADTTVTQAVNQWRDIQAAADAYNLRLGSPATTHYNDRWIQDFMAIVDAPDSGLRVDFMCVHWYKSPNPDTFMNDLAWVHNQWGRDVWVTEFNAADWDGTNNYTQAQCYTFMAEVLYRMEREDWLKRYAIFPWDGTSEPSKASPVFEPGTNDLTPLGKLYASWDGDIDGPDDETWYFLHHQSSHKRIGTNGTDIEMTTIFNMGDRVRWKLVNAGKGWYYLEHSSFDRRLGYDNAAGRLARFSNTETGDHLKWQPVHSEHGWYFIDHKSTSKRLHYRSDWANATLEGRNYMNSNMKWRFIKP